MPRQHDLHLHHHHVAAPGGGAAAARAAPRGARESVLAAAESEVRANPADVPQSQGGLPARADGGEELRAAGRSAEGVQFERLSGAAQVARLHARHSQAAVRHRALRGRGGRLRDHPGPIES